jgi:diamine N-acetyltransferase
MSDGTRTVLEGVLVRLISLGEEHLAKSLAWVNDPFIMATVLRVLPVTWEDQKRWYENLRSDPSKRGYAIHWREDGRHIGNTGLYHIDRRHLRAEFWIYLGEPAYRGKGAAGEALTLMRTLAFEELGLERLYLHVGVDNRPARNLYNRHGFVEEGILRRHYVIEGRPVDVAVMSQLRSEYDPQKYYS